MRRSLCNGLVLIFLLSGLPARAQDRSSLLLQANFSARDGLIESMCRGGAQTSIGGSVRYYVTEKTSVGGEGEGLVRCDQIFTFYAPRAAGMLQTAHDFRSGRFRPYVIGGVGLVFHRSQFARSQIKGDVAGGGGLRFMLSKRAFIATEETIGTGGSGTFRFAVSFGFVRR